MGFFGIVITVLAVLIVVILVSTVRTTASREEARSFTGEVVARSTRTVQLTAGSRQDFVLTIRTDEGQEIHLPVSSRVYDRFAVGDPLVKLPGARWPVPVD